MSERILSNLDTQLKVVCFAMSLIHGLGGGVKVKK